MGAIFKKTFTKPLPLGAEVFERKGKTFARWKDRAGKAQLAAMSNAKDGAPRIKIEAETYVAKWRDGAGIVREVSTGCRDAGAARAVLADLERRAELVKAGVIAQGESVVADHQRQPFSAHLEDYLASLKAKGVSPRRIDNVRWQLKKVAEECSFLRLGDMGRARLERWMDANRQEGMATGTANSYLAMAKAFGNWCRANDRLASNPFERIALLKGETVRNRRALDESEIAALLEVARRRPLAEATAIRRGERRGQHEAKLSAEVREDLERLGWERSLIYRTLLMTGLRRGELASITMGQTELVQHSESSRLNLIMSLQRGASPCKSIERPWPWSG